MIHFSRQICVTALLAIPVALTAQTRAFVARLGVDTFAVERVSRHGNTVDGAVARQTPTATVLRYTLIFNPDSSIASYRESIFLPDGAPVPRTPEGVAQTDMKMTFVGDTVVREIRQNGKTVVLRNPATGLVLPSVGGTSPYWQELVVQAIKRQNSNTFGFYSFSPGQTAPNTLEARMVGPDSAEIIFPQGFYRGYKLDSQGQLVHGDASNTTVRLEITPVPDADIDALSRQWAAKEASGKGMGVPSPRDSTIAIVGGTRVSIDYGRPAKRGRVIWGKLVPLDTVWRLGANAPTILSTEKSLKIDGITLAAGSYSLWLVPSDRTPYLLVNSQTRGWTGVPLHDATQDLARIPVRKHSGPPAGEERFRILIQDGLLMMLWDDGGYEVSVSAAP